MNISIENIRRIGRAIIVILAIISVISITLRIVEFNDYSQKRIKGEISQEEYMNKTNDFITYFINMLIPDEVNIVAFFNWSPILTIVALIVYRWFSEGL